MNPSNHDATPPSSSQPCGRAAGCDGARLLYSGAALLLLILMLMGFQYFYLSGKAFPGRELNPAIRPLLIAHGIAMTAWMLLFLGQPLLIVFGHRHVHRMLGRVGAGLAAGVVLLGFQVAMASARINPPDLRLWGLAPNQFMAISVISIVIFAVFVAVGVWNRRRPEVHRPMMLLSVLAVMPAAIDRIDGITSLYRDTAWGTIFGPFFGTLAFGLGFLIINRLLTRSWDRYYAIGYAGLLVANVSIMRLASTDVWDRFTRFLLQ